MKTSLGALATDLAYTPALSPTEVPSLYRAGPGLLPGIHAFPLNSKLPVSVLRSLSLYTLGEFLVPVERLHTHRAERERDAV